MTPQSHIRNFSIIAHIDHGKSTLADQFLLMTGANAFLAMENELAIVPVLNKIDLNVARPSEVIAEMEQALGVAPNDVLRASGKTGQGVDDVLRAIIARIPAPAGSPDGPLRAL